MCNMKHYEVHFSMWINSAFRDEWRLKTVTADSEESAILKLKKRLGGSWQNVKLCIKCYPRLINKVRFCNNLGGVSFEQHIFNCCITIGNIGYLLEM